MSVRPALRGAAALAATALVVTGCGGGDEPAPAGSEATGGPSSSAFPVTVETAFGDVTVEEEPTRVVALGWSDAETALALGVEPVGASDWLAVGGEDGLGDWVEQGYEEPPVLIETLEPSFEAIAALEPDLILDTRSSGEESRYELLSQIAPTIGQPEGVGPYQTTWQQQLELVGQALGRAEEADELATQVEEAFAEAAAEHPEFDGTEVAVGAYTSEGFGAYVSGDSRVRFMEQLGFQNKAEIEALATENFFVPVSEEQLSLLDAELTVVFPIFVEASEFTGDPLWQALPAVQEGRAVVLEDLTVLNAFSSASAPGLLYAIDATVPLFADALD
ncbi:iron-siderophore ABC transporter substrate-binding protein [Blastococcus sp. MG754426]|uniref:iron-siderophore ABC transporter substrate-binding protein n=1 Tax=unclassified Blastococcus TaxID=2619396 RepID=UPI001EEF8AB0|nr:MULTISPECIES: iron-siderophore ABC transporter substrate-binding protein [unclassified Blastococcus]MCF6506740.1 iron-siderophore ABC transporter substrate-binding protein [Blastococcus sp. MG754426]MCF6511311.1 iron-siderophore ABC transporter substrate-binding protein [Blastococcus sp. MG754427]MCF6734765.1 iron-siderophore ABC transporter substrate-binding protein [Blastococcus sp. KM273129]